MIQPIRNGLLLCLVGVSLAASAAGLPEVIFRDGFEKPRFDPGPLSPQGNWMTQGEAAPVIQRKVVLAGKQAVRTQRGEDRDESIMAWRSFAPLEGKVRITAHLRAEKMSDAGDRFDALYVYLNEYTTDRAVIFYLWNNGEIRVHDGPTLRQVGKWKPDTWYKIEIVCDTAKRTFDVIVNGARAAKKCGFLDEAATAVGGVALQEYGGVPDHGLCFDDVSVEVLP
ncbi:MAG: hypothetical protein JXB04_03230, partial [Kiritimatiellae bacterium]|nr:hypothetical protein [Kiritimatiellia bacterium]